MRSLRNLILVLCLTAVVTFLTGGCFSYSSLQSARLVKPGESEITPSYSSVRFGNEGESEKVTSQYGAQLGIGINKRSNARFRYERIQWDEDVADGGYNFAAVEPKVALIEDVLAFSLPVGLWFGEDVEESDSWQIHPSLHMTALVYPYLEINGSAKFLHFFQESTDDLIGLNVGIGIGYMGQLILRPEIGWLLNPNASGHYFHWSFGFSLYSR